MTDLTDRIAAVLDLHYGGWIDNGKPDECRCPCGYRPSLGESHGAHVAAAVVEELGLKEERHIVAWQNAQAIGQSRYVTEWD